MNRKELMSIMPKNAADLPAAMRIIELNYPTVGPVMRDMVQCMRVAESPVADAFAKFFGRLGAPAISVIATGLRKNNCWLRHRILTEIISQWPLDVVKQLSLDLTMLATQPDAYDNDLRCIALLAKFQLAETKWLQEWISFKKDRIADRNKLLVEAEKTIKSFQQ